MQSISLINPRFLIIIIVGCVVAVSPTWADGLDELAQQQKLTPSDANVGDMFGISVAIDGNTAVAGAYHDDDNGSNSGSAYVFTRNGCGWQQQQKLTAPDAAAGDEFGCSVAIDEDTIVVGSCLDGSGIGSAYVFAYDGSTWSQQKKLTADDGSSNDQFGYSVCIDEDTIVVGAYQADPCGTDSGAAYVFTRSGSAWSQQQKIIASDGSADDLFGHSVSVDGNSTIIGAYQDDPCGTNSGSAYVYTRSGSTWSLQQKLTADDGDVNDHFGYSVNIWDYVAAVGATGDSNSAGAAYTFIRDGSTWDQDDKLYDDNDQHNSEYFGCSVGLDEDRTIVGISSDQVNGIPTGAVYDLPVELVVGGDAKWHIAYDGASGDNFGCSVSLYSNYFITGASGGDDNGTDSGSAYVFCTNCPKTDLNQDGRVDFMDFAILACQWLQTPGQPSADIVPFHARDGIVNILDLRVLAAQWLQP